MEEIKTLKGYFSKLQHTILNNSDFKFFNKALVKKSKIDDILCCIFATLPPYYKKLLNMHGVKQYQSVIVYNSLVKSLKKNFVFNPDVYLINVGEINKMIGAIQKSIESDINSLKKLYDE